jgi:uroporphyrinogen decarboxylase
MGGELSFEQGVGPRFANPIRNAEDVAQLSVDCLDKLQYVADAIKVIQQRLQGRIPLIGFAGAPFTILSYLVEGGSSKDFKKTKLLLNNDPELAHTILQKIADVTIGYLNMQVDAGVNALQLFDSWASALSWDDYKEFSHKYNSYILANIKRTVPVISFCKGGSVFAPLMVEAKPDVISIDWNADLKHIKQSIPTGIAVQGNLDPFVLFADKKVIETKILRLFERMRGEQGFIFNLGHGIMPDMSFDHVKHAVDVVKSFRY